MLEEIEAYKRMSEDDQYVTKWEFKKYYGRHHEGVGEEREEIFENRKKFLEEYDIIKNKGIANKFIVAQIEEYQAHFFVEVFESYSDYIFLLTEDSLYCSPEDKELNEKNRERLERDGYREYGKMWGCTRYPERGVRTYIKTIRRC